MAKTVLLGIKVLPNGVDKRAFAERFGLSVDEVYGAAIQDSEEAGLVRRFPRRELCPDFFLSGPVRGYARGTSVQGRSKNSYELI